MVPRLFLTYYCNITQPFLHQFQDDSNDPFYFSGADPSDKLLTRLSVPLLLMPLSLTVSVLIMAIFRKAQMAIACFLAGVLMDADRVLDYYMNYGRNDGAGYPRSLHNFLGSFWSFHREERQFPKVFKILHSIELLILLLLLYILGIRNTIIIGILIGFALHLIMDLVAFGHIGAVSMIYKMSKGFPSGSDIVKQRLSSMGRDIDKCQFCGTHSEIVLRFQYNWYIGFTKKGLSKIMLMCLECEDRTLNDRRAGG